MDYMLVEKASKLQVTLSWVKPYEESAFWLDPNRWVDVPTTNGKLEPFWLHQNRKKPVVTKKAFKYKYFSINSINNVRYLGKKLTIASSKKDAETIVSKDVNKIAVYSLKNPRIFCAVFLEKSLELYAHNYQPGSIVPFKK